MPIQMPGQPAGRQQQVAPLSLDALIQDPRVQQYVLSQKMDTIEKSLEQIALVTGGPNSERTIQALVQGVKQGVTSAIEDVQQRATEAPKQAPPVPQVERAPQAVQRAPEAPEGPTAAREQAVQPPVPPVESAQTQQGPPVPAEGGNAPGSPGQTTTPTSAFNPTAVGAQGMVRPRSYQFAEGRASIDPYQPITGMTYAQGRSLGGSLKQIEAEAARRINDIQSPYTQDDQGNFVERETGRILTGGAAIRAAQSLSRVGRVKQVLAPVMTKLGAGEGIAGALGGLTKVAGPVGVAVGAVTTAIQASEKLHSMAQPYQQMTGTGLTGGLEGWAKEHLYGLTGLGTMGMGAAQEQYRAVSELGLEGDQRDQALSFMRNMYSQFGFDTSQSLQFVKQASKDSTISLEDLGRRISDVGKRAVAAGGDFSSAAALFSQNITAVNQGVASGPPGVQYAQALTNVTTQLQHTPLQGLGTAGFLGTDNGLLMAATAENVPVQQLMQRLSQPGQVGGRQAILANNAVVKFFLEDLLGITPEEQQAVSRILYNQNLGKEPETLTSGQAELALMHVLGMRLPSPTMIIQAAQQVGFGNTGGDSTDNPLVPGNAYILVCFAILGKLDAKVPPKQHGRTPDQVMPKGRVQIDQPLIGLHGTANLSQFETTKLGYGLGWGGEPTVGGTLGEAGYQHLDQGGVTRGYNPIEDYYNRMMKTGKRNVVIEDLLKPENLQRLGTDARFVIDGKQVTLKQVIDQYGDKLTNPNMRVMVNGTPNTLSNFTDAFKGPAPTQRQGSSPNTAGLSASQLLQPQQQKVTVDLTDPAKQLIRVLNMNNGPTASQRNGVPAPATSAPWAVWNR